MFLFQSRSLQSYNQASVRHGKMNTTNEASSKAMNPTKLNGFEKKDEVKLFNYTRWEYCILITLISFCKHELLVAVYLCFYLSFFHSLSSPHPRHQSAYQLFIEEFKMTNTSIPYINRSFSIAFMVSIEWSDPAIGFDTEFSIELFFLLFHRNDF